MLEDHKRTGAYYQGVMQNRRQFEGKVVLDVGTGSGILAIFAAKAGAKKVYAVEATNMAKFAKELVKENDVRSSSRKQTLIWLLCLSNMVRDAVHVALQLAKSLSTP
jgi:ribosomal protein L11 methylase PrmA